MKKCREQNNNISKKMPSEQIHFDFVKIPFTMLRTSTLACIFAALAYLAFLLQSPSSTYSYSIPGLPSWPVFKLTALSSKFLFQATRAVQPGSLLSFEHGLAFVSTKSLYAIVKLEVVDEIGDEGMEVEKIAEKKELDADYLLRVLRYLTAEGYFRMDGSKIFLTEAGVLLRMDHPASMRWCIIYWAEEAEKIHNGMISELKGQRKLYSKKIDKNPFELYKERPESESFSKCMAGINANSNLAQFAEYNFGLHETLVDISGGVGDAARSILDLYYYGVSLNSKLKRVIIMNVPEVFAQQKEINTNPAMSFVEGYLIGASAFPSGDVILINNVLQNWSNDEAVSILRKAAAATNRGGRIIVADVAIPDPSSACSRAITRLDVFISTISPGSLRTVDEYNLLWLQAGLKLVDMRPTRSLGKLWILDPNKQ